MQTKQEILKRAYEAHFSSQKYEKSNFGHTYKAVSESAMDEWAEVEAISILEWIKNKEYKTDAAGFWYEPPMYVYEGDFGLCVATNPEQLYQLYKKETQQTKTS